MDNVAIYRTVEVYELVARFRVELEFLPPYSPDLNPIELSFNILKA
jgi:transposase